MGEKIALIDTVKKPFYDEMLARISSIIDPAKIDYIISNHAEMDHTGALLQTIRSVKPEKVIASIKGAEALLKHYGPELKIQPVKSGDSLDLGTVHLMFEETRMVHWPDSMVTYMPEDKILFSQDAFGMHLASSERFADQIDSSVLYREAATYFANILMPLVVPISSRLDALTKTGWKFDIIAPDHGPIWRQNVSWIVNNYTQWLQRKPTNKAVIVFGTMWESTELMARAISDGLIEGGVRVSLMSVDKCFRSDVAAEVLDAGALFVGSPTLNNNIFPSVMDVLTYLKGLRPKNLIGAAFGSHGWSGEAPEQIAEVLRSMKVEMPEPPLKITYVPQENELIQCREFGIRMAKKLNNYIESYKNNRG
ncbi:MAG: FprA family A-type flavoprotein [Elusimicrobia bacterium]|nr:FprA family A-type flavoprotein [Candidatus Obscuribacterium magneticum]